MHNTSRKLFPLAVLALSVLTTPHVQAHVSYSGRTFGTFDGLSNASATISNQTVSGNFGWADAADADWGDSHKVRWFQFTLTNAAEVTFTASANPGATPTPMGGLIPGFSLYSGVAPSAAHDGTDLTLAYRNSLGFPTEGALNTLGDFQIGNTSTIKQLTFIGHALDGVGYLGDGAADGVTSRTFSLAAGTYSLIVGGGDYLAQLTRNPQFASAYGLTASLSVSPVPEPSTYALALAGLAGLAVVAGIRLRRRPALV